MMLHAVLPPCGASWSEESGHDRAKPCAHHDHVVTWDMRAAVESYHAVSLRGRSYPARLVCVAEIASRCALAMTAHQLTWMLSSFPSRAYLS